MAQIVLYNVSNDEKYFPQRRDMFNEARWTEAKRLMAQVLRQHSKEAARRSSRFLQDRMVAGDHGKVNDCAAGSGRLLLAHYIEKSKLDHSAGRRFEYVAQDSDPIACKMCALNLMAHGMYGRVECRDTLRMNEPTVVYVINEVKYPFNTPYYSVRKILAENRK